MNLIEELHLVETQNQTYKELKYSCEIINSLYREWKKVRRRKNAIDIVSTTVNKLANVHPESLKFIDFEVKQKLVTVLMRCMDNPLWKPVSVKEKIYKKLYPLLSALQTEKVNTGTNSNLREVIMTRISASMCSQDKENSNKCFVCYEHIMPKDYLDYIFGKDMPKYTVRMQAMLLPEDFETLIETLKINIDKAKKRITKSQFEIAD